MHITLDALTIARSIVTVALALLFVALCIWAWSDRRRAEFDAAARLPFDDEEGRG